MRQTKKLPIRDRHEFWKFCYRSVAAAKSRAAKIGLPHSIDAHFVDRLMVDGRYRCAVTGIPFELPNKVNPFGPSLDRIVPKRGYVDGNVRLVCWIVNLAMNQWGEEAAAEVNQRRRTMRRLWLRLWHRIFWKPIDSGGEAPPVYVRRWCR